MPVRIDEAAIAALFRDPAGPVQRDAFATATAILDVAKTLCPKSGQEHADGSPPLSETGSVVPAPGGLGYLVRFDASYAAAVHNGSQPHDIYPRNARVLTFVVGGARVYTTHVSHPGFKGNPWLRDAGHLVHAFPLI